MRRSSQQGFTLIEAAVAIAVVAILSGIIVPLVVKNLQDSQIARAKNDVQVIAAAIASQIKDTGSRPGVGPGPGGAAGGTYALWASAGAAPTGPTATAPAANSFTDLFTFDKSTALAQDLFYGTATTVTSANEFSYKGPYLAGDVAIKSDPWGTQYLILGYNAAGQTANSPIWIVSAGPDKSILTGNVPAAANPAGIWTTTTTSADDIVVRVN
jgi:prepilin-type N-terminal cleavage/methylation domain-containing protein